jgi:hypothetical protein
MYPYIMRYNNIPDKLYKQFNNTGIDLENARKFSKKEIIRYATPQEIEQYKLNTIQNKYNI